MSPPPRHTLKAPTYTDLPAEWIRLYNRVAVDLGFTYPAGPAHHLDLYSIALGGWRGWGVCALGLGLRACKAGACMHAVGPAGGASVRALPSDSPCVHACPRRAAAPPLPAAPADCLVWCSREGLHVVDTVNEVALQQLANLLPHVEAWRRA